MMLRPVGLIPKTHFALTRLKNRLGLSTTDVVNRALQFYDMAEDCRLQGQSLYVRNGDDFHQLHWTGPDPAATKGDTGAADVWQECVDWMAVQGQADVKGWLLEAAEQANPYAEPL